MGYESIHDLNSRNKPREKMERYGAQKLRDYELLAILIGSGVKGNDVMKIAKKADVEIRKRRQATGKIGLDEKDFLSGITGLGKVKRQTIQAILEYAERVHDDRGKKESSTVTPETVWQSLPDMRKAKKEYFLIILLDSRGREQSREVVSEGTLTASLVHPREVFHSAVRKKAVSIIGVHNHPSNDTDPSDADIHITERLVEAGNILGVNFENHVIISKDNYYSMEDEMPELFD